MNVINAVSIAIACYLCVFFEMNPFLAYLLGFLIAVPVCVAAGFAIAISKSLCEIVYFAITKEHLK